MGGVRTMYNPKLAKDQWYNNINHIREITIKLFSGSRILYRNGYIAPRGDYIKELHLSEGFIHFPDLVRIVNWSLGRGIQEVSIIGIQGDCHHYTYKRKSNFIFTRTNWVNNLERSRSFILKFYDGSSLKGRRIEGKLFDSSNGRLIDFSKINYKAVTEVSIVDLQGRLFTFKEGE